VISENGQLVLDEMDPDFVPSAIYGAFKKTNFVEFKIVAEMSDPVHPIRDKQIYSRSIKFFTLEKSKNSYGQAEFHFIEYSANLTVNGLKYLKSIKIQYFYNKKIL